MSSAPAWFTEVNFSCRATSPAVIIYSGICDPMTRGQVCLPEAQMVKDPVGKHALRPLDCPSCLSHWHIVCILLPVHRFCSETRVVCRNMYMPLFDFLSEINPRISDPFFFGMPKTMGRIDPWGCRLSETFSESYMTVGCHQHPIYFAPPLADIGENNPVVRLNTPSLLWSRRSEYSWKPTNVGAQWQFRCGTINSATCAVHASDTQALRMNNGIHWPWCVWHAVMTKETLCTWIRGLHEQKRRELPVELESPPPHQWSLTSADWEHSHLHCERTSEPASQWTRCVLSCLRA